MKPPYEISPAILDSIERIGERLGVVSGASGGDAAPQLRRGNRIRTIQASLSIEGNTLSLEQVTAVLEGKRVLGTPREIQEVRNAFAAYDQVTGWSPSSSEDLLSAHELMMQGLVDRPGKFRTGNVGIQGGDERLHVAPPADRVPGLINDLLNWVATTNEHPLIVSCVFHYEFEFIHPFADGNGRIGRLWQTLILGSWRPLLFLVPIESVVRDRQADYYRALREADKTATATVFIEFMLEAVLQALHEISSSEQVNVQVSEQVKTLLNTLASGPKSKRELLAVLGLSNAYMNYKRNLVPILEQGLIAMTIPDKPNSRLQKYRLTDKGQALLADINGKEKGNHQ